MMCDAKQITENIIVASSHTRIISTPRVTVASGLFKRVLVLDLYMKKGAAGTGKVMQDEEQGYLLVWTFMIFIAVFVLVYANTDDEQGRGPSTHNDIWEAIDEEVEDI